MREDGLVGYAWVEDELPLHDSSCGGSGVCGMGDRSLPQGPRGKAIGVTGGGEYWISPLWSPMSLKS